MLGVAFSFSVKSAGKGNMKMSNRQWFYALLLLLQFEKTYFLVMF